MPNFNLLWWFTINITEFLDQVPVLGMHVSQLPGTVGVFKQIETLRHPSKDKRDARSLFFIIRKVRFKRTQSI